MQSEQEKAAVEYARASVDQTAMHFAHGESFYDRPEWEVIEERLDRAWRVIAGTPLEAAVSKFCIALNEFEDALTAARKAPDAA